MIIIGKGVKPAAKTKSTTKVAIIIGTSGKRKKNKKRRNAARKKGTKFKGIF